MVIDYVKVESPFLLIIRYEKVGKIHPSQYKIGEAYQYFQSKWLKEVFYHPVNRTTTYCFLRAECTPISEPGSEPHKV